MGHAESPVLSIIRGAIRDKVGLSRQRVNVPTKLCERHVLAHGDTVAHYVQVGPGKVNNSLAPAILDIYMYRECSTREGSSNQIPLCPSAPRMSPTQRAHQFDSTFAGRHFR